MTETEQKELAAELVKVRDAARDLHDATKETLSVMTGHIEYMREIISKLADMLDDRLPPLKLRYTYDEAYQAVRKAKAYLDFSAYNKTPHS